MPPRPRFAAAGLVLAACGLAAGPYADLPPLDIVCPPAVVGGVEVSRPLSVDADPGPADPLLGPARVPACPVAADRLFGGTWTTFEYLAWWPKGPPLPALVTATRGPGPPVAGGPNTLALIGGRPAESRAAGGGRFTQGFALDPAAVGGRRGHVLLSGHEHRVRRHRRPADRRSGRPRQVGRPFTDALTGRPGVLPVNGPTVAGGVAVTTAVRVTGWEGERPVARRLDPGRPAARPRRVPVLHGQRGAAD